MTNTITVELTPKDSEMLQAWQRQRDNIAAFASEIEKAGHSAQHANKDTETWTDNIQKGLEESVKKVGKFIGGFALIETTAEKVVDSFDKWIEDLDEVVKKEREAKKELEEYLVLAGKLDKAPAVEAGLENITTATREQKSAIHKGVLDAAPNLDEQKQLRLTEQIAPIAQATGTEGARTIGQVAGTFQEAAPNRAAFDVANMAKAMVEMVSKEQRGQLSSPAGLKALETLQQHAGMSEEQAGGFIAEALGHGGSMRQIQNISQALGAHHHLRRQVHSHEDAEYNRFFSTEDPKARLEMLRKSRDMQTAVLGDSAGDFMGKMTAEGEAGFTQRLMASHQGQGLINRSRQEYNRQHPQAARMQELAIQKERGEEEQAKYLRVPERKVEQAESSEQLAEVYGRGWLANSVDWASTGLDKLQHYVRPHWLHEWRRKHGLEPGPTESEGAAEPGVRGDSGSSAPTVESLEAQNQSNLQQLVRLQEQINGHLQRAADKPQAPHSPVQVSVNVQGGGRRVDYSARNDYSHAAVLGHGSE